MYQERFKETNNEQLLKYYECEHSLNMVRERLGKIEALMSGGGGGGSGGGRKCTPSSVNRYQEELHKASSDLECLDANLKLIGKLSSRIGGELREDARMHRLVDELREAQTRLGEARVSVAECARNLTKIHSYAVAIDEAVHALDAWCADADALVRVEPEHLNLEQLGQQLDRQKVTTNSVRYSTISHILTNRIIKYNRFKKIKILKSYKL